MKIILRYGNNIQWLQHKQLVKHSSNILWNTCSLQRLQHQTIIIWHIYIKTTKVKIQAGFTLKGGETFYSIIEIISGKLSFFSIVK